MLTGPTTLAVGQTGTFNLVANNNGGLAAQIDRVAIAADASDTCTNPDLVTIQASGQGTYPISWTPTHPGSYIVSARIWNDAISECRSDNLCVDGPPRFLCPGADNCRLSVNVTGSAEPTDTPAYCSQQSSITLSGAQAVDAGAITLKVKFQGSFLDNITQNNFVKNVKVTVIKQIAEGGTNIGLQTISSKTFNSVTLINTKHKDANGIAIWQGTFTPTGIAPGSNYSILVKGPHHLQRKFCVNNPTEKAEEGLPYICQKPGQISLTQNANVLDFSGVLLQGGDLPGPKGQDGVVNAYDISLLLNILNKGTSRDTNDVKTSDIDYNGIVNAKDRSNIIETLEEKYGDDEAF